MCTSFILSKIRLRSPLLNYTVVALNEVMAFFMRLSERDTSKIAARDLQKRQKKSRDTSLSFRQHDIHSDGIDPVKA